MFRMLLAASALLALFASDAVAQTNFVQWRNGTAVVRSASAVCRQHNIFVNDVFSARYRHPGLADNGARARLSLFGRRVAHHITVDGDFNNTFQFANFAVFVGGGVVTNSQVTNPYTPEIRMTKRTPNTIDETTKQIYMFVKIRNFFVDNGVDGCNLDLEMTIVQ